MLRDAHGREITYLRVSVTDRCNLRCLYCTPPPPEPGSERNLARAEILSYEELERVVALFAAAGVSKVRLTGGEPLVRRDLPGFAARLAAIPGLEILALTTNGSLLARHARDLRRAGVSRINISLDTLDREQFLRMTGSDALADVLLGIEAALAAGFERVKINSVMIRGVNEDQAVPLARLAAERPLHVRFIEYMPVERPGGPRGETVPAEEIRAGLERRFGRLEPLGGDGVSTVFRAAGHAGTIGLIAPVTGRFCERCNRLRLTADGHLKPCLLSDAEYDLLAPLRAGAADRELLNLIDKVLAERPRHHGLELGTAAGSAGPEGMRRVGG